MSPKSQEGGSCWHPASQSSLTEPKISSITVSVDDLSSWEEQWMDFHRDHADPDGGDEYCGYDDIQHQFGALPDYDPDKDEDGPVHLLMCCGTKRPRGKVVSLVVKPTVSGKDFVTVHDYLSAVHPWLMSLREDILDVMGLWDDQPWPAETKLMVNYTSPHDLKMYDRATWIQQARKASKPPVGGFNFTEQNIYVAGHGNV